MESWILSTNQYRMRYEGWVEGLSPDPVFVTTSIITIITLALHCRWYLLHPFTFNYKLLLGGGTTQYRGLLPKLRHYPKMLMLLSLRKMSKRSRLPKTMLRLQMSHLKITHAWIFILQNDGQTITTSCSFQPTFWLCPKADIKPCRWLF